MHEGRRRLLQIDLEPFGAGSRDVFDDYRSRTKPCAFLSPEVAVDLRSGDLAIGQILDLAEDSGTGAALDP